METVRAILSAHPSGISRAGILAWAKLRIDPDFDEARLDAELGALGSEVVERDGFLWLASSASAPAPLPASPASGPASWAPVSHDETASAPIPRWQPPETLWSGPEESDRSAEPAITGWRAPGGTSDAPGDAGPTGGDAGPIPGWRGSWPRIPPAVFLFLLMMGAAILVTNLIGGSLDGDASPSVPVGGSLGTVDDLSIGDCIALPQQDEFYDVTFTSCDSPHDAEIFFLGDYDGGADAYPDDGEFEAFADARCGPAFEDYTGSAYDDQDLLDFGWFTPTQEGWAQGDRMVNCYLLPADGSTATVSYRGANP